LPRDSNFLNGIDPYGINTEDTFNLMSFVYFLEIVNYHLVAAVGNVEVWK
jgi:energy-converting hydrogenase Eha subunit H